MKRVLGAVLAGLVGAGTLFSGVGVAHAEEEVLTEEVATDEAVAEEVTVESNENVEEGTKEAVEKTTEEQTNENTDEVTTINEEGTSEIIENENNEVTYGGGGEEEYVEKVLNAVQLGDEFSYPAPAENGVTRYSVLVLDRSGSMSGTPMDVAKKAAKKFCNQVFNANGTNYVAIVGFDDETEIYTGFTNSEQVANEAIEKIYDWGGTDYVDGLTPADNFLKNIPSGSNIIKNIIFMSDGAPNYDGDDAIKQVEGFPEDYNVYTLGFLHSIYDPEYARTVLQSMVKGKGYYIEVTDVDDLEFAFGEVAGDITKNEEYPVIVVPGIMGSNLYDFSDYQVWAPSGSRASALLYITNADIDVNDFLYGKYNDINQYDEFLKKRQLEYGAGDVYANLVNRLVSNFSHVYFFSYDWRRSNSESAWDLKEQIDDVLKMTGSDKVNIVAHSMGGLVTSKYISTYDRNSEKVNKIITCGTPYEGAASLVHRALSDTTIDSSLDAVLRTVGITQDFKQKMPSLAELAPTKGLFEKATWKLQEKKEEYEAREKKQKSGAVTESGLFSKNVTYKMDYDLFKEFCNKTFNNKKDGKAYKAHYDSQAIDFHNSIKNNGVNVLYNLPNTYFIIGIGQKTIESATVSYNDVTLGPADNYITDIKYQNTGDKTVPYESASMLGLLDKDEMKGRVFRYITTHGGTAGNKEKGVEKGATEAVECIISLLKDEQPNISYNKTGRRYQQIRIACPVEVNVEQNGETLSSVNNLETSFGSIDLIGKAGEIKSVYLEDGVYRLNLNGTDSGTMDLALRWFDENNDQITEKEFLDIPVTASTLMYIDTLQDGTSELMVDTDGNGTIDDTWYSNVGDVGYRIIEEEQKQEEQKQEEQKQEQKQEEQKQEEQKQEAQPVSVVKAAQVTSATTASKTGDTNLTALWITLSAVSAGIVTAMVVAIKKRRAE